MRTEGWTALALVALLCAPALAETGTYAERRIERAVASPLSDDGAAWLLELPPETYVVVTAVDASGNLFALRANRTGSDLWLPASAASLALDAPGSWRVDLDPVAGAAVDVRVTFRGHVADAGGAPAIFTLHDAEATRGCLVAGACLP